jgi:hypothetical protein
MKAWDLGLGGVGWQMRRHWQWSQKLHFTLSLLLLLLPSACLKLLSPQQMGFRVSKSLAHLWGARKLERDLVDTSTHASCRIRHNSSKWWGLPTTWRQSSKEGDGLQGSMNELATFRVWSPLGRVTPDYLWG